MAIKRRGSAVLDLKRGSNYPTLVLGDLAGKRPMSPEPSRRTDWNHIDRGRTDWGQTDWERNPLDDCLFV
jgi:hypothetical protein